LTKKWISGIGLFAIIIALLLPSTGQAQNSEREKAIESLKRTIETEKNNLAALRTYINTIGFPNDEVIIQFDAWMKQFPGSANFPYALGEAYFNKRDRNAINYLIKAYQIDPQRERLMQMIMMVAHEKWEVVLPQTAYTIDSLKNIIANNPDSLLPLRQYIYQMGIDNDTMPAQFNEWAKQFPQSSAIPFALGSEYIDAESPRAKPWLLKVAALEPNNARVWSMLSVDAERWGDQKSACEFMGKAAAAEPANPDYSFYYAFSFEHTDPARWRSLVYELAKRFPNNERGAQGLYWLAARSTQLAEKVKVYEQLRTLYPPDKFGWSGSGMPSLYDCYLLQNETGKAKALAQAMGAKNNWPDRVALINTVENVHALLAAKKIQEALQQIDKLKAPAYSGIGDHIALLRSSVLHESGNTQAAYENLLLVETKTPGDEIKKAMVNYGAILGKNTGQVENDIWMSREKYITKAADFNLGLYTSNKTASLRDFKGKIILLTFWFPGCGPCRAEFPHFENVLKKFKSKDIVYLGINVMPEQDDYVLPFMQKTKYSFIPLRGTTGWAEKAYKVRGQPTNFLIDGDGRIVFSNFMIHGDNERMLELMIASMLAKKELVKK
jgi:thiol-disulfide isomerase/thioredoxin